MTLQVTMVRYDVIGDQAEIAMAKTVGGHSWTVHATFPVKALGHDPETPDQRRIIAEAKRVFLEAAAACES